MFAAIQSFIQTWTLDGDFFFFPSPKRRVGAEEKLTEELYESIVIKVPPSTRLFHREALDAFALMPDLVIKKEICQRTYELCHRSYSPSFTLLICKKVTGGRKWWKLLLTFRPYALANLQNLAKIKITQLVGCCLVFITERISDSRQPS